MVQAAETIHTMDEAINRASAGSTQPGSPPGSTLSSRSAGSGARWHHHNDGTGDPVINDAVKETGTLGPEGVTEAIDRLLMENANLRRKLETQPVIEQAKGILMGHYGVDADTAFEMLRHRSQDSNTKLACIAEILTRGQSEQTTTSGRHAPPPASSLFPPAARTKTPPGGPRP